MVSILSTMKVGNAKDANGVEIKIDPEAVTDGVIRQAQDLLYRRISSDEHHIYSAPEPFVCSIIPRSARTENLIHDAAHVNA
jgi:hypothetical protein